ncbi:kinase-like domain-containing protein [Chlamydoabsidia padenii]|nr:kinase-like domain-containing protein [Chlamydoabsidia padenii]
MFETDDTTEDLEGRASSTTTEPSDKFYSAVSTRSSTVYYSPTEPNPTNSTVSFDRPNIHHEQKSKRQLPSDAIDYFDNNKGAWVYLKSMTAGIESYGLGGFTPENTVDPSGYLVGSNRECDIRIPLLDDRHFVIYNYWESDDSGGYSSSIRVVDRSTNGFFVDDYQIPKSMVVTIKDGQIIQLVGENIKDVVKFEICLPMPLIQLKTHRSKRAIADLYHFDKKEKFSSGNFGDVFRATCIKTNEVVALKRILLTGIPGHVFQSFFRELSVNLSLKPHPCIIRLKDYGEERRLSQYDNGEKRFEKILYMVLEFGQDRDLFYYVQDCYQHSGTIPEQDALCIFDQIFHATAYLHSQGIAHRDLKLENVIVINKAMLQVKLCDFGVSSYEQKFTPFVTCCGTQDYSAPELLAPGKNGYTKAVDIWSLGVMLYILLEGKTPYSGCNAKEEMIKRIKSGNFPCFNSDKWKYVSDQCKDLIKKMMTAEPRQRLDIGQVLSHPWSRYAEQLPNRNPSLISYLKK